VDGDLNFGLTCGTIIFYIIIYSFFGLLIWGLTTKITVNRSLRNLFIDIYEKRVKYGFLHEILWIYCLPVIFYAIIQMKNYQAVSALYGFNIFLSFILFVSVLVLLFIFLRKIYQNRENIL
jgi:hypothetical protein